MPRLLDLFCGAGGAAMGYNLAGFDEIIGVDMHPQPRYPFRFIRGDALEYLRLNGKGFDAIHASPPCQKFTLFQQSQPSRGNAHQDLVGAVRNLLHQTGRPYIIENVVGSPLLSPVRLCGSAFGLGVPRGQLLRHRLFESNVSLVGTTCKHYGPSVMVCGHGKDGYRGNGLNASEARDAMQISWMNRNELAQAIPPAYTEFIGRQLLPHR
jgi:DNA (cytosine-5)-methyltransferase 1